MKTARLFIAALYLHLALSIAAPVGILILNWQREEFSEGGKLLVLSWLAGTVLAVVLGWICAVMGFVARHQRHMGRLVSGWRLLKMKTIPFYVLYFVWSGVVCGALIISSRGALLPLLLIPAGLVCLFVFQSGCLGLALVHTMRRHGDGPSLFHYPGQILPVLDVVSTLFLMRSLHVDNIN
ncbi:MAG: hypothetical protein HFF90_11660 [Oscillibacter sp.]|nr:hypothetical protein [Oscillibacter sp.]